VSQVHSYRCSRLDWVVGAGAVIASSTAPLQAAEAPANLQIATVAREPACEGFYAKELGLFAKHGLTVDITMLGNGAAIGAAVASGAVPVGNSNVLAVAQASQRGIPLVIIVPAGIHDSKYPNSACVVAPDSPITRPRDLNDKVVAGASIGGYDQLCFSSLIDKDGGDSRTVKFVEVPQGAMAEALAAGRIQAATLSDPELSIAGARVRRLADAEAAIAPRAVQTVWVATNDWLSQHKDAARSFAAAIFEAGSWAMAHPVEAANVLQRTIGLSEPEAKQRYATNFDVSLIQPILDSARKYNLLQASVNAKQIAWDGR
jgi:NitT/TauT family transport system substrate-binding protein